MNINEIFDLIKQNKLIVLIGLLGLGFCIYLIRFLIRKLVQKPFEQKSRDEAEKFNNSQAEQKRKEEAIKFTQAQAEQKHKEEAAKLAQAQAEQKRKEEAAKLAQAQAEQKHKEEAAKLAQAQAEQKRKEEAAKLAQAQAEQKRKEEAVVIREVEKEEQKNIKYIGYKPINIFAQSEPLNFPYVVMPAPNCVIKFPKKGKIGRKGYKEDEFKSVLLDFFARNFKIYDDRFLQVKNFANPFEPDLVLIDENNKKNIFVDIEIDEPYEGTNDILTRKALHFQQVDISRNNYFRNRGWIVIRFAEIQIHQNPKGCCLFVANVIKSINPDYEIPSKLNGVHLLSPIPQWTEEEALKWSLQKYREQYLGIDEFGIINLPLTINSIEENPLDKEVEEQVKDEETKPKAKHQGVYVSESDIVQAAIKSNKYLGFSYENKKRIVKPVSVIANKFVAYCYIKNINVEFEIKNIKNLEIKNTPFTLEVKGIEIGLETIRNAINIAIQNGKYIRMQYTRSAWNEVFVDESTGELFVNSTEAEQSIRTISNVDYAQNVLNQNELNAYNLNNQNHTYIRAYCHKRSEERTFRFDRISEIAILDI